MEQITNKRYQGWLNTAMAERTVLSVRAKLDCRRVSAVEPERKAAIQRVEFVLSDIARDIRGRKEERK